jgi:hypothetical protein
MASVLHDKSEIRRRVGSIPPAATYGKPSKIPVRSGNSSGSASDDSDGPAKSALRIKSPGKSQLPIAVKTPVKNVVHSSKSAGTSGRRSVPEKSSQISNGGVQQKKTEKTNINSRSKAGDTGAKAADNKKTISKPPSRLEALAPIKRSPSVNQARCKGTIGLGSQVLPGTKKKLGSIKLLGQVQQGRLRPARNSSKAKKDNGLPEEEQEKPLGGIVPKSSFKQIPVIGQISASENLPEKVRV